jgi:hypothetical protein
MESGCIGKSHTNNLPIPTDLTENPYGKKTFLQAASQKSARVVPTGISIELYYTSRFLKNVLIFEKMGGF